MYLHFVDIGLGSLHFAHDGALFGVFHPPLDAERYAVVSAVFCESTSWTMAA